MTAPEDRPTNDSAARTMLAGCAFLLLLLAAVVVLAVLLWSSLRSDGSDRRGPAPSTSSPDGGTLTRSRREELTRELEQVERDLRFAEGQAQVAIDPTTRQAWVERARELRARRDELRTVLGR